MALGIPCWVCGIRGGGSWTTTVSSSSTHTRWAVLQGWTPHWCKHRRWAASLAWADSHCSSGPSFRPCGQHRLGEQLHVYSPANVSALSLGVLVWFSPVWAVITRLIQGWAASRRSPAGRFGHHCSVGSFALIFQLYLSACPLESWLGHAGVGGLVLIDQPDTSAFPFGRLDCGPRPTADTY